MTHQCSLFKFKESMIHDKIQPLTNEDWREGFVAHNDDMVGTACHKHPGSLPGHGQQPELPLQSLLISLWDFSGKENQ